MDKIAKALVIAQKKFSPALKTSINPHFKSRYADLSACIEAVIDALNDSGIALVQKTKPHDAGIIVETVFIHESGETLSCGELFVPAQKHDAQGFGSALTYGRRYSLMAACGHAQEDDDGNAASKKHAEKPSGKVAQAFGLSEGRKAMIANQAISIENFMGNQCIEEAFNEYSTITDVEEKTHLWSLLDSKTRSTLKAYGQKK